MMSYKFFILFILVTTLTNRSQGQSSLIINEDRPSLIDTLLQVAWEPSSLIRWWTGLDQLYNIALSWRTAAKTVVTLPFLEGRSMNHVRIQEPRRARAMIKLQSRQLNMNHMDRFNKVYSQGPNSVVPQVASTAVLQRHVLPPPFLFRPQDVFINPNVADFSQLLALNQEYQPFPKEFGGTVQLQQFQPKNLELLNREIMSGNAGPRPNTQKFLSESSINMPAPFPFGGNAATNLNPEVKLRMVLKLLKDLGAVHTNKVVFDEDLREGIR